MDILLKILNLVHVVLIIKWIDKVEGRSDDIFYFEGQGGRTGDTIPIFIRRCISLLWKMLETIKSSNIQRRLLKSVCSQRDEQVEVAITAQFQLWRSKTV